MTANTFIRFSQPVLTGNNAQATDAGSIEVVDVNTGNTLLTTTTLEGQLSTVTGNGRAVISSRGITVDQAGSTATCSRPPA